MARGAVGGFVIGAAVAVVAMGVVSVVTYPVAPQPEADSLAPMDEVLPEGATSENAATLPATTSAVAPAGSTPVVRQQPAENQDLAVAVDTAPGAAPLAAAPQSALTVPQIDDTNEPLLAATDMPIVAAPSATAPLMPNPDSDPVAVAAPTRLQTPKTPELAPTPSEGRAPLRPADVAGAPDAADSPSSPNIAALNTAPGTSPRVETAPAPAPQADLAPGRVAAKIVALPRSETSQSASDRLELPRIGSLAEAAPRLGTPAVQLTDRAKDDTVPSTDTTPAAGPLPPLIANSVRFDNPEDKPLMSIVLIDSGDSQIGLEALASFPYPLSFAVDAASPTAHARMRRYRDAGFEVLAMTDMPLGATASDTETLLRAGLHELPLVVAVMEGPQTGLQSSKTVSDQTAAILVETGHGLVLFPKGLNTAQKLALKSGVPAASVFRDFDSKGQNAAVIRRFLDQAAFKARQEEIGVVMVGRLQPETISALLLWGLQDRANRVALAPISALLRNLQN